MEPYVLVSHRLCPYVQRAVITLIEKAIAYRRVDIDLAAKPGWFRALSPLGKVPLLRAGDAVLFESAVICEYLDEVTPGSLHPADPLERARHRAWIEFASATLDAIGAFYNAPDAASFDTRRRTLVDRFAWLERHLGDGPHFAGRRFHLVDAAWGPVFRYFDTIERIGVPDLFEPTPRVAAWRRALAARPSVRDAVAPDYPEQLLEFLRRRDSHLSTLIEAGVPRAA